MELRDVRAFVAVADHRHFAAAAAELGLSQPALSARIRHLEDTLGLTLVQRGARFEGLTAEGERLLPWARRVLAQAAHLIDVAADAHGQLNREIVLGVVPSALPFAAQFASKLQARHTQAVIEIRSMTAQRIAAELAAFRLDAGLSYVDPDLAVGLESAPLYDERYSALVPGDSMLAGRDVIAWAEIATEPLALLSRDMRFRQIIDRALAEAQSSVTPRLTSNAFDGVLAFVRTTRCSTILPSAWAEAVTEPGFVLRPMAPAIGQPTVGLVIRSEEPRPPLTTALIAVARALRRSKT